MKALKADQIRLNVINRKWLPRILNDRYSYSRPQKDDFNKVLQMLITSVYDMINRHRKVK